MQAANRCLDRAMPHIVESPIAHGSLLSAVIDETNPGPHLVISATDSEQGQQLKAWADANYRLDCYLIRPSDGELPGILENYRSDGPVTAWLCQGMQCLPPVSTKEELEQQLKSMSTP